jgi:hypothetical protein
MRHDAEEVVTEAKAALWRVLSSAWMIVVLVIVGWGPIFIAEAVRRTSPELDAGYRPQSFAMQWMLITVLCSVLAILLVLVHALRLLFGVLRRRTTPLPGKGT